MIIGPMVDSRSLLSDRTRVGSSNLKAEHKNILERGDTVPSSLVIAVYLFQASGTSTHKNVRY